MRSYVSMGALPPGVHRFGPGGAAEAAGDSESVERSGLAGVGGWGAPGAQDPLQLPDPWAPRQGYPMLGGAPNFPCPCPSPPASAPAGRAVWAWATQLPWPAHLREPGPPRASPRHLDCLEEIDGAAAAPAAGPAPWWPPGLAAGQPALSHPALDHPGNAPSPGPWGAAELTADAILPLGSWAAAGAGAHRCAPAAPRERPSGPPEAACGSLAGGWGPGGSPPRPRPLALSADGPPAAEGPPSPAATSPAVAAHPAGQAAEVCLPAALREGKARYDRWRRSHFSRRVEHFRSRYPRLWARVCGEIPAGGRRNASARHRASAFLRRAAAHAAELGEPPENKVRTPAALQSDHAAYQRAFRQLWAERREANPDLWRRCSSGDVSDTRAWTLFRRGWGQGARD